MAKIYVLHGPNLNMLGTRETNIYGDVDLDDINQHLCQVAQSCGHSLDIEQFNGEHEIIDAIQQAKNKQYAMIIINPAAYTHTSVAIRDALLAVEIPYIEVHLSNIFAREPFRHHSYLSDGAVGVISGFGPMSYQLALQAADHYINQANN